MSYIQISLHKCPSIRNAVSLIALSSIMIMGGCKSKTGDTAAVEEANVVINTADYGDIGDVLKTAPRKTTAQDAEAALKAIGLWDAGSKLSWESRSGSAGQYNFKNIKITTSDEEGVTIKSLNLGGLHMDGDVVRADIADFGGLTINDQREDLTLEIEHLGLTDLPLSKNLGAINQIDDLLGFGALKINNDEPSQGPSGAVFRGVSGTSDKTVFEIDTLGWGQDPKDQHIRFAAEDVMIKSEDTTPITLRLETAKLRSLNPVNLAEAETAGDLSQAGGFLDMLAANPQIGDMTVEGFDIQSAAVSVNLPSLKQSAQQNGNVTTINSDMPELSIDISAPENLPADAQSVLGIIQTLGFDKMVFSAKSAAEMDKSKDSVTIKAASFDLQDGFDLNYKGEISGLSRLNNINPNAGPDDIKAVQDMVKIHGLALSLEDKSIVERGFNLAGAMMGKTPKGLRREANGALALGSLAALTRKDGAIYGELARALGEFIQDGGTLTIQLAPDTPITLNDLQDLQGGQIPDLKRLGLSSARTE